MSEVLVERDGDIATVVLNRPAKLNALTRPMWRMLGDAFEALSADDAVRGDVVRGAGDLRICGASSRFGAPIKKLGLVMAYAEMAPLVKLVGESAALEILLEGRIFDAAEARDKGLVTRVVPDDRVGAEVDETARRIADGAPLVARWHKRFARRLGDPRPLSDAELDECFDCFDTEDFRIGYAAFLAKRAPRFEGR